MLLMCSLKAVAAIAMVRRSLALAGRPSVGGLCTRLSAMDRHGIPCSASKGVMFVSESGVQFHTCAMIGI